LMVISPSLSRPSSSLNFL